MPATGQLLCSSSILEIRLVRVGSVAIKSAHTGFYLATNKKGKVYGQYNPSCEFRERTEENGYNTHAALCGRPAGCLMFLAGKGKGKPRQWGRTRCQDLSAHFLPVFIS